MEYPAAGMVCKMGFVLEEFVAFSALYRILYQKHGEKSRGRLISNLFLIPILVFDLFVHYCCYLLILQGASVAPWGSTFGELHHDPALVLIVE